MKILFKHQTALLSDNDPPLLWEETKTHQRIDLEKMVAMFDFVTNSSSFLPILDQWKVSADVIHVTVEQPSIPPCKKPGKSNQWFQIKRQKGFSQVHDDPFYPNLKQTRIYKI